MRLEAVVSAVEDSWRLGHAHQGELDGVDAQLEQVGAHLLELLARDGDVQ